MTFVPQVSSAFVNLYSSLHSPNQRRSDYKSTHFLVFFFVTGYKTALTASANTSLTPSCSRAEHSMYLTAPICLAKALPCCWVVGARPCSFSFFTVSPSLLRSLFVPTRRMGTLGQWWDTSGCHLCLTLAWEEGLPMEKQMMNTLVCG